MSDGKISFMISHLPTNKPDISVAPMIKVTDRHCRAFLRLFSRHIKLYSEMVVTGSLIYGKPERALNFNECEHPVVLQLGGCDPVDMAKSAIMGEQAGYDEINMNVGCPSDRVKSGKFGACLMAHPELVADCVASMISAVSIPVTVKTRIGIDDMDSYDELCHFIKTVNHAGCQHFIIHARKAWLNGLSPKENRTIPPLDYHRVYQLKLDFPDIVFSINGGVTSLDQCSQHLEKVDGVMIGREAYQNPWMLTDVDQLYFNDMTTKPQSRFSIVEDYMEYIESQLSQGIYLRHMTQHLLNLFHGQPGAKSWRRYLSEHAPKRNAGLDVVRKALLFVDENEISDITLQSNNSVDDRSLMLSC